MPLFGRIGVFIISFLLVLHILLIYRYSFKLLCTGGESLENRRNRSPFSFCLFRGYRWCGPGCSGPGEPINDVDACCKHHDRCLSSGKSRCQCDREFMDCLHDKRNRQTDKGRKAALMYDFMKVRTSFTCGPTRSEQNGRPFF